MAWKCSAAREKLKSFNPGPRLDMRISLVTFCSARRFLIDVLILFWRENARSEGTLDTGIVLAILGSFAQSGKICAFTPNATGRQDPIQSERRDAYRANFSREKTGDNFLFVAPHFSRGQASAFTRICATTNLLELKYFNFDANFA